MPPLSNSRFKILIGCLVLVMVIGCSRSRPLYPSYEELTQRGFYVYVVPEKEVERRGWSQTVTLSSWDRHCRGVTESENFNPIRVIYRDPQNLRGLTLLLGPWAMYWDHGRPTLEAAIETAWADEDTAVYYVTNDEYLHLKFKDRFGIPVQILARLPITEVIQLVNQLEYIGPPPENVSNPWDLSRCSRR